MSATEPPPEGESGRIGVLLPGDGLGDGIMRIPFLHAIRRRWPQNRVWWVTSGPTALGTALNRYVVDDIERFHSGFGIESDGAELRSKARMLPHFGVIFNFYSRIGSVLAARRALAPAEHYACLPFQIGSSRRDPGWLINRPASKLLRIRSMAAAARLSLRPVRESFPVTAAATAAARRLIPAGSPAIGLAVGRGNVVVDKEWPIERFVALARILLSRGQRPVFLIGPAERTLIPSLQAEVPGATLIELYRPDPETGAEGVDLCLAVGAAFTAAVTIDAGLAHVLAVMNLPLVSLFGPTDPRRWAPDVEQIELVLAKRFGSERMEAIPIEAVDQALTKLMERIGNREAVAPGIRT